MSRFNSFSRSKPRVSESSESGLLTSPCREDYGVMAQLHPPYVTEARAVAVEERATDPKRYFYYCSCRHAYTVYTRTVALFPHKLAKALRAFAGSGAG